MSVYGILYLSGVRFSADFAAESALSFPFTPMWLGIQHIRISFVLDMESNLLRSLMIRGSSSFLFLNDSKTESESENMIYLLCLFSEMIFSARSIAQVSAVNMELSFGRAFLMILLFEMAAHPVLGAICKDVEVVWVMF